MKIVIALLLSIFLVGCAAGPQAKRLQLNSTLLALGKQADNLQRAGVISNDTEDKIINQLILINKINLGSDTTTCGTDKAQCIDNLLSEAIRMLEVAQ